jgi:hypothetical protein
MSVRGTRDTRIIWQGDEPGLPDPAVPFTGSPGEVHEDRNGVSLEKLLAGVQAQLAGLVAADREEAC